MPRLSPFSNGHCPSAPSHGPMATHIHSLLGRITGTVVHKLQKVLPMLITTRARGCSNDSPCGKVYCNWCWDHRKALGKLSGTPKPKLTATGLPEGHSYAVANPEKLFRCCRAFLEAYVLAAEASRNSVITEATVACSICGYVLKLKDGVWNR